MRVSVLIHSLTDVRGTGYKFEAVLWSSLFMWNLLADGANNAP